MDELALERRFGVIEAALIAADRNASLNHSTLLLAVGKIEAKVEMQNGAVARLVEARIIHEQVPHSAVSSTESSMQIARVEEMWTAWSIGKWVGAAATLALIGQTAALMMLALR